MYSFSLLSFVPILFLFWAHLSEEKKLRGERESDTCVAKEQDTKGECDDFCESWNKTTKTHCLMEVPVPSFFGVDVESVGSCYCSTEHDASPRWEYVYQCVIKGCSGYRCDDECHCGFNWECHGGSCDCGEEETLLTERTLAQCPAGDLEESCADFCEGWEQGANSFCVVGSFGTEQIGELASCFCTPNRGDDSDPEVYACFKGNCGNYCGDVEICDDD